jgi:DNA-binding response OmpR family regulator
VANPKVLIVDDEPDVVLMIERTLRSEGFNVAKAYDGIGALDLVSTEKPDLILLDIMMPMMSGYEVCEQLKANPQTQHIPVICLSSAHTPNARALSLRAGAAELIAKPFLPAELAAQIRRHLKSQPS